MGERIPPHHSPPHRSVTALALSKARAFAAPCHPAPRQRLRHWLYLPRYRRPFCPAPASPLRRPAITPLASLRLAGATVAGADAPSRQRRLLPGGLPGYTCRTPDCRSATRFGQYPRRVIATSAREIQGPLMGCWPVVCKDVRLINERWPGEIPALTGTPPSRHQGESSLIANPGNVCPRAGGHSLTAPATSQQGTVRAA